MPAMHRGRLAARIPSSGPWAEVEAVHALQSRYNVWSRDECDGSASGSPGDGPYNPSTEVRMQSSSLGTAPALRSFRLETEISSPSAVVHWLIMGMLLGIILTTSVLVALFLMVTTAYPDGISLLQAWYGGGYAEIPLEIEMAPVGLRARVPLEPLIITDEQWSAPPPTDTVGGAGTTPDAPDAPAVAGALAPTAAGDGTRAATLLDGS